MFSFFAGEYLPNLCFFDSIKIHCNDQLIRCIHTGDLFLSNSYPPIEGTTLGYLAALEHIIGMCDEHTIVIPGHGPISDRDGLRKYHEMISIASSRINSLKSEGKNLKEVLDSNPLTGLLDGESMVSEELFIYCVFNDGIPY